MAEILWACGFVVSILGGFLFRSRKNNVAVPRSANDREKSKKREKNEYLKKRLRKVLW